MSRESRVVAGLLLVVLPTVMAGGVSILTLLIGTPELCVLRWWVAEEGAAPMRALGWKEVEIIGHDLGVSAAIGSARREGFERVTSDRVLSLMGVNPDPSGDAGSTR